MAERTLVDEFMKDNKQSLWFHRASYQGDHLCFIHHEKMIVRSYWEINYLKSLSYWRRVYNTFIYLSLSHESQ